MPIAIRCHKSQRNCKKSDVYASIKKWFLEAEHYRGALIQSNFVFSGHRHQYI